MLTLILCRALPLNWVRAGALAAGGDAIVLCAGRGGGGELCTTADGRRLAHLCGYRPEHADGAGRHRRVVDKVYRFEISRQKHD